MATKLWSGCGGTKTRFLMTMISVAFCLPASAQQRTPNNQTQGILRSWPANGGWEVALTRLLDGAFGCLLLTGHADQTSGERYFWGIRLRDQNLAVEIIDNNPQAVSGDSIQVVIDRVPVGTFPITRRLDTPGISFHTALAELPSSDKQRIVNLIGVGGTIQFLTANSTYSAPLQGAQQSMQNFQTCTLEATHLNGASAPR
jgi:hypothetical protein